MLNWSNHSEKSMFSPQAKRGSEVMGIGNFSRIYMNNSPGGLFPRSPQIYVFKAKHLTHFVTFTYGEEHVFSTVEEADCCEIFPRGSVSCS